MTGLAILASGMVTSVGLSAPATCAAIRCGLDNNQETRFMDQSGEWISAAMVPLEQPWRGLAKLKHMVVSAIRECLSVLDADIPTTMIPLFLCVAEENRPGRLQGLDAQFLNAVQDELGVTFHPQSAIIAEGRIGPVQAIRQMTAQQQARYCIVAGVDSFLTAGTLRAYEERMRLLTEQNSNGFIPGEAGAAVLVGQRDSGLMIRGIGFGKEAAHIESEEPLRADGLVKVINEALADAKLDNGDIDLKIFDANGEQYIFKEAALAKIRIFREPKKEFDIWHPAECTGEVGAATVPIMLGVTLAASIKKYTPGNRILCHLGNDDGRRAAMIICSETTGVTNG
jgi:3-oxoacyl-[acyl-carrier-protein] synthase-1